MNWTTVEVLERIEEASKELRPELLKVRRAMLKGSEPEAVEAWSSVIVRMRELIDGLQARFPDEDREGMVFTFGLEVGANLDELSAPAARVGVH